MNWTTDELAKATAFVELLYVGCHVQLVSIEDFVLVFYIDGSTPIEIERGDF